MKHFRLDPLHTSLVYNSCERYLYWSNWLQLQEIFRLKLLRFIWEAETYGTHWLLSYQSQRTIVF